MLMQRIDNQPNKPIVTPAEDKDKDILLKPTDYWTHARFKYEFFKCLRTIKDPNKSNSVTEDQRIFLKDYKYYAQARKLRPWIPIAKRAELIPPFIINISDLTPRIRKELKEFIEFNNAKEVNFLLREIATKFFENIDPDYTHESVLSHLVVRLEN